MTWSARDWRQNIATVLLALAAIPLTVAFYAAQWTVRENPRNDHAYYLGIAAAVLLGLIIVALAMILGRRTFKFKVGTADIEATGEDADHVLEGAT
jgi:hypothetical protein